MMTVLSPVSPDDDAAAVLAGLVGDGSPGESLRDLHVPAAVHQLYQLYQQLTIG